MTIKEVSTMFELTADTLRYYEKIGLLDPVERKSGIRHYQQHDLERIDFIKCMRKGGLSIEALQRYVALHKEGDSTLAQRKEILIEQKMKIDQKLQEFQETSERLAYKINNYEQTIMVREQQLFKSTQPQEQHAQKKVVAAN